MTSKYRNPGFILLWEKRVKLPLKCDSYGTNPAEKVKADKIIRARKAESRKGRQSQSIHVIHSSDYVR